MNAVVAIKPKFLLDDLNTSLVLYLHFFYPINTFFTRKKDLSKQHLHESFSHNFLEEQNGHHFPFLHYLIVFQKNVNRNYNQTKIFYETI
jgi:hypothetical protein